LALSTQYDYEGPDIWKPNEPPNLTPEQKAAVEDVENETMKRFFFKPEMFEAATLAVGCMLFGGNMAKKLFMILGDTFEKWFGDNYASSFVQTTTSPRSGPAHLTPSIGTSTRARAPAHSPSSCTSTSYSPALKFLGRMPSSCSNA